MENRILFKGGCSNSYIGLVGPNNFTEMEYQPVCVLKNREVALLDIEYQKECAEKESQPLVPLIVKKKRRGADDGASLAASVLYGGLTKAGRLAKNCQQSIRGRKNNKKRNEKSQTLVIKDDVVSDENNQDKLLERNAAQKKMVPISALEVMLVEGESNQLNDEQCRKYRLQAERLFNIGMNLGVTTNSDRISMVEKLMDLEENEVDAIEVWEEEEVS
jgi:hypothetical protein